MILIHLDSVASGTTTEATTPINSVQSPEMQDTDSKSKDEQKTFLEDDCENNNYENISSTVFYLTISTIAAGLLCLIFMTTTTIMCCKYYFKSNAIRQQQHYYDSTPGSPSHASGPFNVSMSRRKTDEPVYMTLEDPNSPEGRVLLPKEVFDEFYNRTLSLRRSSNV